VKSTGNYDWTDDSGDGIQEPLLDVRTFVPTLIPVGAANSPPNVTISSPAEGDAFSVGAAIGFVGTADDHEDGSLTGSLVWTSDLDGQIGTGGSFSTTLSAGTHKVTATVTDSGGLTDFDSRTIIVAPSGAITLSVTAYTVRNTKYADLIWSGAAGTNVNVYRNTKVITTANDGAYTDKPGKVSSVTYKVCNVGTSTCSDSVTVGW
jgi:hypothetical protein